MEIKIEDPVCGMSVDPMKIPFQHTHGGTGYHFCSPDCMDKFAADPEAYLGEHTHAPPAEATPAYACPNLPEVEQSGPGTCSRCGSRLEPVADPEKDKKSGKRRSWWPFSK